MISDCLPSLASDIYTHTHSLLEVYTLRRLDSDSPDARGAAAASTRATKEAGSCMATVLRGHKKDSAGGTGEERCSIYV